MAINDGNNYFEKRKINCINRMDAVIEELPFFCREFFIGIENNTSPLTRLNYAMDLRIFFDYLVKNVYKAKFMQELTLADMDRLDITCFENYLAYLSLYEINGKQESCNERAKARKLATIRAFFKYFFNLRPRTKYLSKRKYNNNGGVCLCTLAH